MKKTIEDKNFKIIQNKYCFSTTATCDILDVTRETLSNWANNGCPKMARGWYPIAEILRWRGMVGTGIKTEEDVNKMSISEQKSYYEKELKKIQSEQAQYKKEMTEGKYLKRDDVIENCTQGFLVLRQSFNAICKKISIEASQYFDSTGARKFENQLKKLMDNALLQLSSDLRYDERQAPSIKL